MLYAAAAAAAVYVPSNCFRLTFTSLFTSQRDSWSLFIVMRYAVLLNQTCVQPVLLNQTPQILKHILVRELLNVGYY